MKWTDSWHPRWMWHGGYSEANINSVVLFMRYTSIPSSFIGSKVWICSIQRENIASMLCNMYIRQRGFGMTQRIHVWYIYLHLADFYDKCWQIYHTWILWVIVDMVDFGFWAKMFLVLGGLTGKTSSLRLPWMRWLRRLLRLLPLVPPERGPWTCCCWALQARPRVVTRSTDRWQGGGAQASIRTAGLQHVIIDRVPLYVKHHYETSFKLT